MYNEKLSVEMEIILSIINIILFKFKKEVNVYITIFVFKTFVINLVKI